jgi:hypothetical protein
MPYLAKLSRTVADLARNLGHVCRGPPWTEPVGVGGGCQRVEARPLGVTSARLVYGDRWSRSVTGRSPTQPSRVDGVAVPECRTASDSAGRAGAGYAYGQARWHRAVGVNQLQLALLGAN